jgi:hypothetical protein
MSAARCLPCWEARLQQDEYKIDLPKGDSQSLLFYAAFQVFLIFPAILTISRVTPFTQLAPFALSCDLDVTPDFSANFVTDVNARELGETKSGPGPRDGPGGISPSLLLVERRAVEHRN